MRVLHSLKKSPVILLSAVLIAFGCWLAYDAMSAKPPATDTSEVSSLTVQAPMIPPAPGHAAIGGVVTADMVSSIKPGMSRAEVEAVIGLPPAELVYPVSDVEGRLTYMTTYIANLDRNTPAGADRIPRGRSLPVPPVAPKSLIALEFDATRAGHPLLKVHYPDPLF